MKKALHQIFLTLLFLGALQSQKALSQDLTIDPGSITFEEGSYMGGDVIRRFRLRVTNIVEPTAQGETVTSYRVDVHLSKDGAFNDVSNAQDDFALHILGGGPIGPGQSQEFTWNQLVPYNVEGQLFVVAKVTTVTGPGDPNLENNSYKPTQGARLNLIPTKGFDAGLISKTTGGMAPSGFSDSPSLSSDARYIAFTSTARDLSFSNGVKSTDFSDVYIQDRINNTTERVSVSSSGAQANGNSFRPSISPDGNLVVFHSDASNLVANDTNLVSDVFVHDKRTGQTLRVSSPDAEMLLLNSGNTQSNGPSYNATISTSSAGIFVVYESSADNLTRRSVTGAITPDTNRSQDIFLYDLLTSKTTRVNINDSGVQASNVNPRLNADSYGARISRDGKSIVFRSEATNLVPGDTNGLSDVFVFNRSVSGAITLDQPFNTSLKRVNVRIDQITGLGAQATRDLLLGGSFPDRGSSYFPDLSSNGRYVVYASEASNLSGAPASISIENGLPGIIGIQITGFPRMKRLNGAVIENPKATPVITVSDGLGLTSTFEFVDNQAAAQSNIEVAVASSDTAANIAASLATAINQKIGTITAVAFGNTVTLTHSLAGYTPSISSELDAKVSPPTVIREADVNLNVGDTITVNDGSTTQIFEAIQFGSVVTPGHIPFAVGVDGETTRDSLIGAINQAGLNVVARGDSSFYNGGQALSIVSKQVGPAPAGFAVSVTSLLSFSPQQQRFTAGTNFVNNRAANVYLTDRDFDGNGIYDEVGLIGGVSGMKSVLISRSPTGEFGIGYYPESARNYYRPDSLEPTISADGRFIAFRSLAVNLLPPSVLRSDSIEVANPYLRSTDIVESSVIAQFSEYNETEDVYVHDRDPGLTGDPRLFDVADITNSFFRNTGNTRVSVNKFGFQTSGLIGLPNIPASRQPQISPDGRYVVFVSDADNNGGIAFDQTNLEPLDSNQKRDVFFLDRRFTQDPAVDLGYPISTILSPVLGNTVSTGSSVVITASAADTNRNGSISNVEFFVNGTSIGFYEAGISNPLSGRYSLTWNVPNATGLLNLYTKVTDNEGNVSTSPVVQVSALVAIGQIPVFSPSKVSLSRNPIPIGSSATLSVVVTDADGRIAGVDFLANGQLIGTVSSAPYSLTWSPTVSGIYDIRALARDNDGNSRSTAEAVLATVASNIAPVASITEPTSDVSVRIGASINLIASVFDPDGSIVKAEIFANGASIAAVSNPGLTVATQWTPSAPGAYSITVIVTDDLGVKSTNSESRIVTVQPIVGSAPAVQVTAPTVGGETTPTPATATLGSRLLFAANASDNTAVTSVRFYADGVLLGAATQQGTTNRWTLAKSLNGAPFNAKGVGIYAITALATDTDGNQTQSAAQGLNLTPPAAGTPPNVTATFPVNGQIVTLGGSLNLQAVATDADGAIASVAAYANGQFVGTATSAPFSITWSPSLNGTYNIVYVVTDDQGATTVTAPISVVVASPVGIAPVVNMLFPITGNGSFTNASTIPLAVSILDSDQPTAIAPSIRFYVDGAVLPALPVRLGNSQNYYIEYATNMLSIGSHVVVVVVTDAAGNSASIASSFTVTQASGPSFIAQPSLTANGATSITITAGDTFGYSLEATKPNGRLTQMEIFLNGISNPQTASSTNLSQNPVTVAPFVSTFYAGQLNGKSGTFALATDDLGNVMVSNLVEITRLDNGEPTVTVVAPLAATSVTFGQPIVMDIEAKVTTSGDIIKSVIFLANSSKLSDTSVTRLPGTDVWRLTFLPSVPSTYAIQAFVTTRGTNGVDPVTGVPFERTKASSLASFTVNPVVGVAPTITLITPTSTTSSTGGNTTVNPFSTTANSQILLVARAVPGANAISQVEFFARNVMGGVNSLGIGDSYVSTNTYQKITNPLAVGTYDVFAVVTDLAGNKIQSTSGAVSVTSSPTGSPPTGGLLFPAAASIHTLGQAVALQALANDAEGAIASVAFYANGVLVDTDTAAPFTGTWTPTVTGSYNLVLVITDSQGSLTVNGSVTVTVNQSTPPSVALVTPGAATTVTAGSTLHLVATASDVDGSVAGVTFYADGVLVATGVQVGSSTTYTANWVPAVGRVTPYSLSARAIDNSKQVSETSSISVVVASVIGIAPKVSVSSPPVGLSTSSVTAFRATASDTDGSVTSVNFILNGEDIGAGIYSSSVRNWVSPTINFSIRGAGEYTLIAIATDNNGNQTTSASVVFTVTTSLVDGILGASINEVFFAAIGRNATEAELLAYVGQLGTGATDYEIAAVLMQTTAFDSTGAVVINAYRVVFGEYPTFSAYQNGLAAINSGIGTATYIDSLYASGDYLAKFGPLPSFATDAAIEKFARSVHFNLTGVNPSTQKSNKMTASDWGLSVAELDAVLRNRKSEISVITDRFSGLTSRSAGAVVAAYINSPIVSDKLLQAIQVRARVAGVILTLTEPNTAISLRETDGLRIYNLLDVAELYGTGSTDVAIKPIFRVLPSDTSVVLGAELKLTAVVISSDGGTTNDVNSKWTYNRSTTLGAGTAVTSSWPVHEFTYTVPAANLASAGTYDFSVTNRNGTASATPVTVTVSPVGPASLPLVNALTVRVPFSIDLGDDRAGMTYVAKPLPAGLKLNSSTGVISGTPTRAGSVVVSYYTVLGKVSSPVKRTTFVVSR